MYIVQVRRSSLWNFPYERAFNSLSTKTYLTHKLASKFLADDSDFETAMKYCAARCGFLCNRTIFALRRRIVSIYLPVNGRNAHLETTTYMPLQMKLKERTHGKSCGLVHSQSRGLFGGQTLSCHWALSIPAAMTDKIKRKAMLAHSSLR